MSGSNKRAIISKTSPEAVETQVRFQTKRFDSLIFDKGYEVWIDKAFKCPCSVKGAGQPLSDCKNCLGIGWVFTNRVETRIAVQSINVNVNYENWTKSVAGTAKITARAVDKLAFMDRIILKDVEGYYNEILRVKKIQEDGVEVEKFFTNYGIISIEDIMCFVDSDSELMYLKEGVDYELSETNDTEIKIINASLKGIELVATIRYRHFQTYHMIDLNRDITKVREKECLTDENLKNMPIMGIARKAHYLFDNNKFEESSELIDNTKGV